MGEESNKKVFIKSENDEIYKEFLGVNEINIEPTQELNQNMNLFCESVIDMGNTLTASFKINVDLMKELRKILGVNSISKKRAKKLLMSRGWSRNEANEIIKEHIMPRTKGNIDNYGIKFRLKGQIQGQIGGQK